MAQLSRTERVNFIFLIKYSSFKLLQFKTRQIFFLSSLAENIRLWRRNEKVTKGNTGVFLLNLIFRIWNKWMCNMTSWRLVPVWDIATFYKWWFLTFHICRDYITFHQMTFHRKCFQLTQGVISRQRTGGGRSVHQWGHHTAQPLPAEGAAAGQDVRGQEPQLRPGPPHRHTQAGLEGKHSSAVSHWLTLQSKIDIFCSKITFSFTFYILKWGELFLPQFHFFLSFKSQFLQCRLWVTFEVRG